MMPNIRLVPRVGWEVAGHPPTPLDPRLLPLLTAIAATGSLAAAVAEVGLSYRGAWGLLREYQRKLGTPLVALERGRGASLARSGEQLLAMEKSAQRRLAHAFERISVEIGAGPRMARVMPGPRLRAAASSDLAMAALADRINAGNESRLDLSFMGSLAALEHYAQGRVDIAGFHVPLGLPQASRAAYLRWLRTRRDRLVGFVDREQGLIVPRGNPQRLRTFRDIATRELRFVNRQRGSGTRLLIDALLKDEGIDGAHIQGYSNEEFTHAAVAATVASGGADAGFGLRAAAVKYSLGFVPQARERYWLCVRSAAVQSAPVMQLVEALQSPAFARIVKRLPGYACPTAGRVVAIDVLRDVEQRT